MCNRHPAEQPAAIASSWSSCCSGSTDQLCSRKQRWAARICCEPIHTGTKSGLRKQLPAAGVAVSHSSKEQAAFKAVAVRFSLCCMQFDQHRRCGCPLPPPQSALQVTQVDPDAQEPLCALPYCPTPLPSLPWHQTTPAAGSITSGEDVTWRCACGASNLSWKEQCTRCRRPNPSPMSGQPLAHTRVVSDLSQGPKKRVWVNPGTRAGKAGQCCVCWGAACHSCAGAPSAPYAGDDHDGC